MHMDNIINTYTTTDDRERYFNITPSICIFYYTAVLKALYNI